MVGAQGFGRAVTTWGEKVAVWAATLVFAVTLVALYAPILIIALGVFYLDSAGNLDFSNPTLRHFVELAGDQSVMAAIRNTIVVGALAVVLSITIALVIALFIHSRPRKGAALLQFLVFLPFLLPPLIIGLSLLIFFREIGIPTGLHLVVLGHALFVLALVLRTILNRLNQLGHSQIHASLDLGATPFQTFRRVVWPQLRGAVLTAAVLAFALSFDETLISLFLVGDQNTLPIRLWAMMRLGISPTVNVVALIVLVASLILVYVATRQMDRRANGPND